MGFWLVFVCSRISYMQPYLSTWKVCDNNTHINRQAGYYFLYTQNQNSIRTANCNTQNCIYRIRKNCANFPKFWLDNMGADRGRPGRVFTIGKQK